MTRTNKKKRRTLFHKAHFSLHQSAMWSETERQPVLTKPLRSPGRSRYTQTLNYYTGTWSQKCVLCLSPDFCRCVQGTGDLLNMPFGGDRKAAVLISLLSASALRLAAHLGNNQSHKHRLYSQSKTDTPCTKPHTHTLRRLHQKDKFQETAGSGT